MKKAIIMAVVLVCAGGLLAQDANRMKYQEVFANQYCTGATTGAVVDVSAFKGNAAFVFSTGASAVTNYTASIVVQHSTATNGTFAALTNLNADAVAVTKSGAVDAAVATVACDLARARKYVRVVATQANDTNAVSVVLVAPMKSE